MNSLNYNDPKTLELIKKTYCKNISNDEFEVFLLICKSSGLNPFKRQIYAIQRGGQMTIQTSIDGYRLIAERTGCYAPGKEPTYEMGEHLPISATAFVKKRTSDGFWHEIGATAYWDEYAQKNSPFWSRMPRLMLSKCAESLALRRAFPNELSGIYTEDEMGQDPQSKPVDIEVAPQIEAKVTIDFDQLEALEKALEGKEALEQKILDHACVTSLKDILKTSYDTYYNRALK